MNNVHVHIFTANYIPRGILGNRLYGLLLKAVKNERLSAKLLLRLKWMTKFSGPKFKRLMALVESLTKKSQRYVLSDLHQEYSIVFPEQAIRFGILTQDMDFICPPAKNSHWSLSNQLYDVLELYREDQFKQHFLFLGIDPRRRENMVNFITGYFNAGFRGLKVYPSSGFLPTDFPDSVYEFAVTYSVPIMTHYNIGTIYYRSNIKNYLPAPKFTTKNHEYYQLNFTNPLHYFRVLEKYPSVKICFGHFCGSMDLKLADQIYLSGFRIQHADDVLGPTPRIGKYSGQDLTYLEKIREYVHPGINVKVSSKKQLLEAGTYWHIFCRDVLLSDRFPNTYTDISYVLCDLEFLTLFNKYYCSNGAPFNSLLERILFGTDFFVNLSHDLKMESDVLRKFVDELNNNTILNQLMNINPTNYFTNTY